MLPEMLNLKFMVYIAITCLEGGVGSEFSLLTSVVSVLYKNRPTSEVAQILTLLPLLLLLFIMYVMVCVQL